MNDLATRVLLAALCGALLVTGSTSAAKWEPTGDPVTRELPRRFLGTIAVMSSAGWQTTRVEVVVERWTTPEERERMLTMLKDKGDFGLAEVMREFDIGFARLGNETPWRLRSAAIWAVDGGYKVRVATERPIDFIETWVGTRSQDYPIGVLELFIPDEGEGEGGILAASQVKYNDDGRLEVKALPNSTGPHKITRVREAKPKTPKKKS